MLRGEINVLEVMEQSNRRKGWTARQRRLVEWIAWRDWCNCTHEAEKQAVERRYGEIIRCVLAKRLRVFKRRQAYRKAITRATTHAERKHAAELLEEGQV